MSKRRPRPPAAGESGLGLFHLGHGERAADAATTPGTAPPAARRLAASHARERGRKSEAAVVRAWRAAGWPDAFRTPGSGSWRPYGAEDSSPFPLDIASGWPVGWAGDREPWAGPWMIEVKWDERVAQPSRAGWIGEAFIRRTLRTVRDQARRYNATVGGAGVTPVAFMRAARQPWRVFVPAGVVIATAADDTWIELDDTTFFAQVATANLTVEPPDV